MSTRQSEASPCRQPSLGIGGVSAPRPDDCRLKASPSQGSLDPASLITERRADPALGSEALMGLEAVLVAHLARALDPVAEIDEGMTLAAGELDMIENHVRAEAAMGLVPVVEAVHHRDAVAQTIA